MPNAAGARLDVVEAAPGEHAVGPFGDDLCLCTQARVLVGFLEEQPASLAVLAAAASHQVPDAAQLLARQLELEMALRVGGVRVAERRPGSAVPDQHRAGTVLLRRDHTFELPVFERVVLDVHCEALVVGVEARALGHRPAQQHAVELEPEVVVQAGGRVLLDDERQPGGAARTDLARRLGRDAEVALPTVAFEGHGSPSASAGWRRHHSGSPGTGGSARKCLNGRAYFGTMPTRGGLSAFSGGASWQLGRWHR